MSLTSTKSGSIKTGDGVTLRYVQAGPASASKLLFIPGWAQTAAQWHKQIDYFSSNNYNVTSYDHRGQGESDTPNHGYRISRLASDLNDLILQLDLKDVTLIGHSMGCSVIWSYWDTFASTRPRVSNLVFVDQSACMTADPTWTTEYSTSISAIHKPGMSFNIANALRGSGALPAVTGLLQSMFTPAVSEEDLQYTIDQNLKMSFENAATLLIEHASNDWRDVLPTITVPTLVIGAEKSLFTAEGMKFIASQIPDAEVRIFDIQEKGSHFMFWENEQLFNEIVGDFLLGTEANYLIRAWEDDDLELFDRTMEKVMSGGELLAGI